MSFAIGQIRSDRLGTPGPALAMCYLSFGVWVPKPPTKTKTVRGDFIPRCTLATRKRDTNSYLITVPVVHDSFLVSHPPN